MLPQSPLASPQEQAKVVIPEGTQIQLSLREPVSSKLSEVGDEVLATVKKDVVVEGTTMLKAGTEILGRVTLVKPAKRPLKGGLLHLSFDRIRLDNGLERKLVAIVQSASDFTRDEKISGNGEGTLKGGKSGGDTLRNVGTAAGIGGATATIIILAGRNGGFGPFGVGGISAGNAAAAGSVIGGSMLAGVLLTKGKEVRLDAGTIVRLKLERPLSVE
jgi:type IV secretion system protein VirB10